jgi:hypothetical protein
LQLGDGIASATQLVEQCVAARAPRPMGERVFAALFGDDDSGPKIDEAGLRQYLKIAASAQHSLAALFPFLARPEFANSAVAATTTAAAAAATPLKRGSQPLAPPTPFPAANMSSASMSSSSSSSLTHGAAPRFNPNDTANALVGARSRAYRESWSVFCRFF